MNPDKIRARAIELLTAAFGPQDWYDKPHGIVVEVDSGGCLESSYETVSVFWDSLGIEYASDDANPEAKWAYGHWHHTAATYHSPPESDFVEVGRCRSLDDAIVKAAGLHAEVAVEHRLSVEAESRFYAEQEETGT